VPLNLYPLIDGKLYQAGLLGDIEAFILQKPSLVIDCTHDMALFGNFSPLFVKIPFYDGTFPIGTKGKELLNNIHSVARMAALAIREGSKVLTHCNAGENRSSLVDGVILINLRAMGLITFGSAVDFIRAKRPGALQNQSFAAYLNGQNGLT